MIENRYERQTDIVNLEYLHDRTVHVVGVGAVGRQVAIQLASMGVPKMMIWDFDVVEAVNLSAQGFREQDLDASKVEAVADMMRQCNSEITVEAINGRFRPSQVRAGDIVFCCVDTMRDRDHIYRRVADKVELFIDGRMNQEVMRVLTVQNSVPNQYMSTLFSDEQAFVGRCTARSTLYSASVLAGIEISMLTKHMRKLPVPQDCLINLTTMELD